MDMSMMQQNQNTAIPELEEGYEYECEYILDLGSGLAESPCPTPTPSYLKRPSPPTIPMNRRRPPQREKEAERDCGICRCGDAAVRPSYFRFHSIGSSWLH
ncbi:hypothetical protein C8R44DRAFT_870538 [Mycena epipterygia]|nr:hypothetical protein C8R44DRAFT_870538 [Mycena epipterygia]